MRQESQWRMNRQVNLSMLVEVIMLAGLIIGSWVNLQRQLDLLQRDVELLLERQKDVCGKLEGLQVRSLSHEYRLQAVEDARLRRQP